MVIRIMKDGSQGDHPSVTLLQGIRDGQGIMIDTQGMVRVMAAGAVRKELCDIFDGSLDDGFFLFPFQNIRAVFLLFFCLFCSLFCFRSLFFFQLIQTAAGGIPDGSVIILLQDLLQNGRVIKCPGHPAPHDRGRIGKGKGSHQGLVAQLDQSQTARLWISGFKNDLPERRGIFNLMDSRHCLSGVKTAPSQTTSVHSRLLFHPESTG